MGRCLVISCDVCNVQQARLKQSPFCLVNMCICCRCTDRQSSCIYFYMNRVTCCCLATDARCCNDALVPVLLQIPFINLIPVTQWWDFTSISTVLSSLMWSVTGSHVGSLHYLVLNIKPFLYPSHTTGKNVCIPWHFTCSAYICSPPFVCISPCEHCQ